MKKIILIISFLFVVLITQAQILTPQVVASGGIFSSVPGISLSQTLGELAVQTLVVNPTMMLTQGFQQPYPDTAQWIYTDIVDPSDAGAKIKLFPNPASDQISVSILSDKDRSYRFTMIDIMGREISSYLYASSSIGALYSFDVSNLADGLYLLVIESADNKFSKTIRFNKI